MADFRTTFVAAVLLYFSCSFLIGCAQQYETVKPETSAYTTVEKVTEPPGTKQEDYSAEVRFANWQSTKTSRARTGDAPSPLDVRNSSPDVITRNRPATQNSYEDVTLQYKILKEPLQKTPETVRQVPRARQGIRKIERRTDEVRETPLERRRPTRVRTTESTTSNPEPITPSLRVPQQEVPLKLPKGFSFENRRQRVKQVPSTTEEIPSTPSPSARPFSRGRVRAKIIENPRKSLKDDDISESDNYPPGFIEKLKKKEENPSASDITGPRRSHLRQRAAKSYPSIAISEANRFRQKYPRINSSTDKPREEITTEDAVSKRNESRQGSRIRYTTPRTTTEKKIKPFRSYGRRFTTTERNENTTQIHTTTISPRQKYLSRLRKSNKILRTTTENIVDEQKKEALEPAENLFYVYPENGTPKGGGTYIEQKMKNFDGELNTEASEEDKTIDKSKAPADVSERTSTTITTTASSTSTTTTTTTTTPASPVTVKQLAGAPPSTRHRFSSRFSRSNRTTVPDDVTPAALPALVADIPTASPINLTSLFDEAPDNTLSVMNIFNNSLPASSTVTNKTISPDSKTTTNRPSTVTVHSSTNSPTNITTKRSAKKKSQNKKSKKSSKTTTASPANALNDRPILRNVASLFAAPETSRKRSGTRKKTSRTTRRTTTTTTTSTTTTTTTTSTTTLNPQEINQIQSYINETMELVQNKTVVPAPIRTVPRLALNALTSETSMEDVTTQPVPTTSTTTSTISATATTATTETPSPKKNCTSQFVFFDYNSTVPIPKQFSDVRRIMVTTSTTTSTTADYFVYGVYPNNTIVRKRAFKAFDYEKYHSPYVIFGIYPNNTIVKKFPNGTIINDEYMTSDNEIRDIMRGSTQKTISTTSGLEEIAEKQESTSAAMKMAGSGTTESRTDDERSGTTDNPKSMFEIIENEIEDEERKDEGLTVTTEPFDLENFEFDVSKNVTTESVGETTTEIPFRFLEDLEVTTVESTTSMDSREGESFYLNDIFGENIVASTTELESTTNSRESTAYVSNENLTSNTTESIREGKSFLLSDTLNENIIDSTTEKTGTTETNMEDKSFSSYDRDEIVSTTEKADTTESVEQDKSIQFNDVPDERIVQSTTESTGTITENIKGDTSTAVAREKLVQSTTENTETTTENIKGDTSTAVTREKLVQSTTENTETTTENIKGDTSTAVTREKLVEITTYRNEITTENNREDNLFDLSAIFRGEYFVESTTEKVGSTTTEGTILQFNDVTDETMTEKQEKLTTEDEVLEFNGALRESTTEKSWRTSTDGKIFEFGIFTEGITERERVTEINSGNNSEFGTYSVENETGNRTEMSRENTRRGKTFDIFAENVVENTTDITIEGKSLVFNDVFTENAIESSTERIGIDFNKEYRLLVNENNNETTTERSVTTTGSTSTEQFLTKLEFDTSPNTERTETRTIDSIDLQQLFQPTTTRYDSSLFGIDVRLGDGPIYRPSTTEAMEVSTALRYIFGSYEDSSISSEVSATTSYPSTTTEATTTSSEKNPSATQATDFEFSDIDIVSSTDRRNSSVLSEVVPINAELSKQLEIKTENTKSTVELDEQSGLINLAYRALGSSDALTPTPNYITSTMKSMNYAEKKVRLKMKRTSTTTAKPENVFIVTPETRAVENEFEFTKKGRVKFVTLTPGVIVTTNFRDGNDVMTMSSQHVQKVTKAPANLPDNVLKSVVGEIQEKSSSPIPDIIKNVEKELQGNGISVSLARRIIEMAIERSVTTVTSQSTETTPYFTTEISTTPQPTIVPSTTPKTEITTAYNELLNTINLNPLSVGVRGEYVQSTTTKKDEVVKEQSTTLRTTTKSSKKTKSSRNSAAMSTLSENDRLLLEAILKQQNSNLSVQEIDKIIENQIRLAEEVRKASKNLKKKPRLTTTTTTTTTQTPPLFGFLISLFSGNSSPSNFPVTRAPIKQTRSRVKSSRARGSMTNTPKSINPDPLKEADEGNSSGERSTRGELVTAAIDVTKAVSKFMGTFFSSAAQSFQAFLSNFGRGR